MDADSEEHDQMPHSMLSYFGLHCLAMFNKKDKGLIRVIMVKL